LRFELTLYIRRLFAAGLTCLATPAAATDVCHQPVDLPVTLAEGVPLVRLTLGNKEAVLILDTGAESTIVSTNAADRLQLPRNMVYPRRLRGLGGGVVGGAVGLPGLAVGGLHLPNFGALVGPIDLPKLGGFVPDGLLGADILSDYDVDLDLAHSRVRLLCSVGEPDWGRPYSVIGANLSVHDRLFFGSTPDGKKIAAIIDTGAQHTVIDSRAALAAGADPQALRREPAKAVRGISGASGIEARPNRFHQLAIGDETLPNPTLLVAPLDLEDADLIVGADFLRDRHIRLSYRSHRIFLGRP
jgi:predicted aspartyl protease